MEYPFEALSPSHEVPTIASNQEDPFNDVIERIGWLNLDATPSISIEQPRPSQKDPPKWLTKTFESVHYDEAGKTRIRSSTRKNGCDDYVLVDDMDVLYDCEWNLSTNFELTSIKKVASHDGWK